MKDARSIYKITEQARNLYAEELFNPTTVATAIEDRAKEGYRDLRLSQLYPFDLSGTAHARKFEDWLEENEYRFAWYATPPFLDPLCSSSSEDYPELVVFW